MENQCFLRKKIAATPALEKLEHVKLAKAKLEKAKRGEGGEGGRKREIETER